MIREDNNNYKFDKLNLHFCSSIAGSIGEISCQLVESFRNEFNLTCEFFEETPIRKDILLLHFIDKRIINHPEFNSFKKKILIQPIDGTSIKQEAVDLFNKFDLIICPANASKSILKENNVIVPIKVVPNYYQSSLLIKNNNKEKIEKYIPKDKFIFYHESTLHPRKGIEILYESFVKAFSNKKYVDDVVLIVKDQLYNVDTFERIESLKRKTIRLQRKYKNPANIIKFSSFLNNSELKKLWYKTDCYVTMAKIEGFGIPMLRSNILRKPILCLNNNNSGYMDYLKDSVDCKMIQTRQQYAEDEFMWLYDDKTAWAVPRIDDAVDMFRYMFEHHQDIKCNILSSDENNKKRSKYLFENVCNQYIDTINDTFFS